MGIINSRYEVSYLGEGLIDNCATMAQAKLIAKNWLLANNGYDEAIGDLRIFDSMARRGAAQEWRMSASGDWRIIGYRPAIATK